MKEQSEKISIVIITFNRSDLLIKTIRSILNQTYPYFELILVDDGSTDNTKDAVESLGDNRIRYFNFGKIGNLSKLRNLGIKESRNEYIAFCDDDDLWYEFKIEEQLKHVINYSMICSNASVIDINDKIIEDKYYKDFSGDFVINKEHLLSSGNSILTSTLLIKKSIMFEKNIFFDEVYITNHCEDYELFLRLSECCEALFLNKNLILKRQHASVSGGFENNLIMLNTSVKILKKYTDKKRRNIYDHATEGILGFRQLIVKISFKLGFSRGLKELKSYFAYISDPGVLKVFLNKKLFKKFKKTLGIKPNAV